eukprot:GEMP01057070.1.p1 GENE.GEMP01057070.1~~GEMP01057070.1.p1  ORF type:complete len:261 (+),score=29.91 GEMP01057070.1:34-816(+)
MSNNANIDKIAPDEEPVKLISFHVERELRLVLHIDDKPISPIPYEQPVNTETPASHNEAPENNCNEIPPAQITQKVCGDTDELDTESDVDIPSPDITAPGCSPPEMPNAAHSAHVPGLPPFTYVRLKGERRATCDAFRNFLQDFLYDTPNTPEREKRFMGPNWGPQSAQITMDSLFGMEDHFRFPWKIDLSCCYATNETWILQHNNRKSKHKTPADIAEVEKMKKSWPTSVKYSLLRTISDGNLTSVLVHNEFHRGVHRP